MARKRGRRKVVKYCARNPILSVGKEHTIGWDLTKEPSAKSYGDIGPDVLSLDRQGGNSSPSKRPRIWGGSPRFHARAKKPHSEPLVRKSLRHNSRKGWASRKYKGDSLGNAARLQSLHGNPTDLRSGGIGRVNQKPDTPYYESEIWRFLWK